MKSIILMLSLILLLTGCKNSQPTPNKQLTVDHYSKIKLESGKILQYYEGTNFVRDDIVDKGYVETAVPDIETAIKISDIILENMKKSNAIFTDYKLYSFKYDKANLMWVASYTPYEEAFQEDVAVFGIGLHIAIRAKNAELYKVWIG